MKKQVEKIILHPSHVKVYRYTEKFIAKNIFAPEINEIAKGISLTSRQVYRIVEELCILGYMAKDAYKKRSIRIEKPLK